jgi:DUF4097 and DUF4098 domain-containing protein YvlB
MRLALLAIIALGSAAPVFAQRYTFERSFDTSGQVSLDASTNRGKITVTTGAANRVVVRGTVTVRVAVDTPANAVDIAQRLAANPPVNRTAEGVLLRPPSEETDRRAVTVAYEVTVPADTRVIAVSDSGALSVADVHGPVMVRTTSAALSLSRLRGDAEVTTGSGAVDIDGVSGDLRVTTSSSAIAARGLDGNVRVMTGSGSVTAESTGAGDIDVTTASSAITVTGATHGLRATSQSGRIEIAGTPGTPWTLSTGSSAIRVTFDTPSNATLDATTRSGSIRLTDVPVSGTQTKQQVHGTIGTGGPTVTMTSRSGSFDIRHR